MELARRLPRTAAVLREGLAIPRSVRVRRDTTRTAAVLRVGPVARTEHIRAVVTGSVAQAS